MAYDVDMLLNCKIKNILYFVWPDGVSCSC